MNGSGCIDPEPRQNLDFVSASGIAAPQGSFKGCDHDLTGRMAQNAPVVTKDHLWGISHFGSNGVFVFGESVEIGAE